MNIVPQSSELNNILSLIETEQATAEADLGPLQTENHDELARHTAQVFHQVTERLGQLEEQAALAFKYSIWIVYRDSLWSNVRVSLVDEQGNVACDEYGEVQYTKFANFREWFDHITAQKSPAVKSGLWNGVTRLYAAVDAGRVGVKPDGQPWQVEDIVGMSERNFSVMASVAHRKEAEGKIDELAGYMQTAMSSTQEELIKLARSKGDSGSRVGVLSVYRSFDEDGNQVIVMTPTEVQYKALAVALGARVKWESVPMATLAAMVGGVGDTSDDNPTFTDLFNSI